MFVIGFSAGGHLAASVGNLWHLKEIYEAVPMEEGVNKPKGVMLIYPVITAGEEESHMGSIRNLLCLDAPLARRVEMAVAWSERL